MVASPLVVSILEQYHLFPAVYISSTWRSKFTDLWSLILNLAVLWFFPSKISSVVLYILASIKCFNVCTRSVPCKPG